METKKTAASLLIIVSTAFFLNSCEEDSKTSKTPTTIETVTAKSTGHNSATVTGRIKKLSDENHGAFGFCFSTSEQPTIKDSILVAGIAPTDTGIYSGDLNNLKPSTLYHVRSFLFEGENYIYGNILSFTTFFPSIPIVTTDTIITIISSDSVLTAGFVISDGGSNVTARGVCWSTTQNPTTANSKTTDGSGTGSFTSFITGLTPGITYYVRAYATNSAGTGYGNQLSFVTLEANIVTDIDGNIYHTVTIGTQTWMVENLKVTRYRDGTPIPNVTDNSAWSSLTTGAYCNYNNTFNNGTIYGRIYNWYAAVDYRNIAPVGWRVPSKDDWMVLITFLGSNDGGKLKESGTEHWISPNTGATNETGFTALPGGWRNWNGIFSWLNYRGAWRSTNPHNSVIEIHYNSSNVFDFNVGRSGTSIRCIKGEGPPPVVNVYTGMAYNISNISAFCQSWVSSAAPVTARGVCWKTSHNPTIADNHTIDGSGTGDFTSHMTGLTPGTNYYYRAYATNTSGTYYSSERSFTTDLYADYRLKYCGNYNFTIYYSRDDLHYPQYSVRDTFYYSGSISIDEDNANQILINYYTYPLCNLAVLSPDGALSNDLCNSAFSYFGGHFSGFNNVNLYMWSGDDIITRHEVTGQKQQ